MGSDDANGENGCDDYTHTDNMNDEYLTMLGLLSSPMVAGSKLSSVMTNLISKIKSTCRTCYKSDLFGTWLSIFGVETALGRLTSDLYCSK